MKSETPGGIQRARERLGVNWANGIFLIAAHSAAIAALFFWSWPAVITAVVLYWVAGSLGIGMGYHRLLTHRGYKVPKPVEYFLAICGTLALEGGPIQWVVTHRIHHAHADRAGDPHTPRDGGWWAHVGWIVSGLITGVIFAAIHPQGWTFIPVLSAIGFVFAALREWRGSILAPMTAHALNNFVMISLLVAMR